MKVGEGGGTRPFRKGQRQALMDNFARVILDVPNELHLILSIITEIIQIAFYSTCGKAGIKDLARG